MSSSSNILVLGSTPSSPDAGARSYATGFDGDASRSRVAGRSAGAASSSSRSEQRDSRASRRARAAGPVASGRSGGGAREDRGVRASRAERGGRAARSERSGQSGRAAKDDAPSRGRAAGTQRAGFSGVLARVMAHRALLIALAVVVVLLLVFYPPVRSLYGASRTNAILSAQLSEATSTRDTLQDEVDSLMTREGIEDEARRRGYVTEGDTAVDMSGVEDADSAASDSTVSETSSDSTEDPWYIQALDFIFCYDASTQGVTER